MRSARCPLPGTPCMRVCVRALTSHGIGEAKCEWSRRALPGADLSPIQGLAGTDAAQLQRAIVELALIAIVDDLVYNACASMM
jgi:hypothetical protein